MVKISSRQHQILELLLTHKAGLSTDELAAKLDISRTAIKQHFAVLEKEGYIKKLMINKTAGRPVVIYGITPVGISYFPKQYAWFLEILLKDLRIEMGADSFQRYIAKLGVKLADQLRGQLEGKDLAGRLAELLKIMTELGYEVSHTTEPETGIITVQADNCVYHDVAQQYQEMCEFDVALMGAVLNHEVKQSSCMATGDCACRFRIDPSPNFPPCSSQEYDRQCR